MSPEQNEPLALGTDFSIDLRALSHNQARYSVEQLIAALEASTTLTELRVDLGVGNSFEPTAENSRRIVAPLCRCIANLRLQNEQHPLKKLELGKAYSCKNSDQNGMYLNVFEQFLLAAKFLGISQLTLHTVYIPIPTQFLLEFCRENSHLRVLEMDTVHFLDSTATVAWPPNDWSQGSCHNFHLDKLILDSVRFFNTASAASFGIFFAHLSVSVMALHSLYADHDDIECRKIVSEFKIPSVEKLTLGVFCSHSKAALKAARDSVTDLTFITRCKCYRDIPDRDEELKYLTRMIRKAAKLKSLLIEEHYYVRVRLSSRMIEAIEGCATITRFAVIHDMRPNLDEPPTPQLRRILARNNELACFVASPSTFPTDKLPSLILQFDNCPSGRYMLARCLPEVLSFQHLMI